MKKARMPYSLSKIKQMAASIEVVFCVLLILSGCNPAQVKKAGLRSDPNIVNSSVLGKAYVYENDPVNATGIQQPATFDISRILNATAQRITPNEKTTLTNDCIFQQRVFLFFETDYDQFTDCIQVLSTDLPGVTPLQPNNGNWIYPPGSTEFYQVQAMYHSNKVIERMMSSVSFLHDKLHFGPKSVPPSVPYRLAEMGTWWFKHTSGTSLMTQTAQLNVYSTITTEALRNNAFYEPAGNSVKLGWTTYPGYKTGDPFHVLMVEDTSIIYHEMGHAFMTTFLNYRNANAVQGPGGSVVWEPLPYQAAPYLGFYSELGAIGEGVADYFSYIINARPTIGDWGFGNFVFGRRPMSEESSQHAPGISLLEDERLSYPDYLVYEPAQPQLPLEDVHSGAGLITSHYLVALTRELQTKCFVDHNTAVDYVMLAMADTFAFLGDLTAQGTDVNQSSRSLVNLHKEAAYDWYYSMRPVSMRRWSQVMAKNLYHHISLNLCPQFGQDESEKLLDMYGLLLFRHYDDNGTYSDSPSETTTGVGIATTFPRFDSYATSFSNGGIQCPFVGSPSCANICPFPGSPKCPSDSQTFGFNYPNFNISPTTIQPTVVEEVNRIKSVIVPKASLVSKAGGLFSSVFIDDTQAFGNAIASQILFQGRVISPSVGLAGPEYNNSNNRISPGEIIAIGLDLVNSSNIPLGGVTVLATPWAHMKIDPALSATDKNKTKPCSINGFPSFTEGAVECGHEVLPPNGARYKPDPLNGTYPSKGLHPVCLVQMSENNETRWVSQDRFRREVLQLQDHQCLGFGTPDFSPAECLARFMPGNEMAFMAKIAPGLSYIETISKPYADFNASVPAAQRIPVSDIPGPASSSVLVMELNKWIPPGTNFTCRLRAQFSNCSDCFESGPNARNEFTDIEYAGHKPFKVFDLNFLVIE